MTGNPVVLNEEKVLKVGNTLRVEELVNNLDRGEAGLCLHPVVPGHKVSWLVGVGPAHLDIKVAWKEVWKLGVGDEATSLFRAS